MLGGPELLILLLGAVVVVAPLVFIVLCAMNKRLSDANRIIGILVILFVPILGIIIYLVLPRLPLEDNQTR